MSVCQLSALTSAVVAGPLAPVAVHLLPAVSVGLNSVFTVAAADGSGAGPVAVGQRLLWTALEAATLRQHLAGDDSAAAAAVDLLLAVTSAAPEPPADGRARVTFSDGAPPETGAAGAAERLSPLALTADSPLQECAARAGQRLMDAVRAASASAGQRRQLVRLLVRVPGVAERVAAGAGDPGRRLYDVLMEPELASGQCQLSVQLLPTVWRLCEAEQRHRLADHVTQVHTHNTGDRAGAGQARRRRVVAHRHRETRLNCRDFWYYRCTFTVRNRCVFCSIT